MMNHDAFSEMDRWDPLGFQADGDGLWMRQLKPGVFVGVRFTDLEEHIPERERGDGFVRYDADVLLADLAAIGPKGLQSVMESCGWEGMPDCERCNGEGDIGTEDDVCPECQGTGNMPRALAACCFRYGSFAPIGGEVGGDVRQVLRSARRQANEMMSDSDALDSAMEKPANLLGQTAKEYMTGDMAPALHRGVAAGNQNAVIITKMYHAAGGQTLGGEVIDLDTLPKPEQAP